MQVLDDMGLTFQEWRPEDEHTEALATLKKYGFTDNQGVIKSAGKPRGLPDEVWEAVDYLCAEWDYAYEG